MLLPASVPLLGNATCTMHGHTSGQQANVSEEGVIDLEGIEGIQASVVDGRHQDVLLALAAGYIALS